MADEEGEAPPPYTYTGGRAAGVEQDVTAGEEPKVLTKTVTLLGAREGDGTAAFYNYVYQTIAGFTEHDTFRSNQIREGMITRQQAMQLVTVENRPRYANIKWYLDTLDLDFRDVIGVINKQPRLYEAG